jgi:uncharacterized protein GlcG (DUF336 family)
MHAFAAGRIAVGLLLISSLACSPTKDPQARDASHPAPSPSPPRSKGVDRDGQLCALAVSTEDLGATWPGSRGIAIAKASTANAFSSDTAPLSTARLYTLSQPGHSLWGAANGNPLNPLCQGAANDTTTGIGKVCGGTIVFGGGLALYKGQTRVGGLGVSGDTSCADHEIAKRVRLAAGLSPSGLPSDEIVYTVADGPSPFAHPLCPNTFRDGIKLGDETPAGGD